MYEEYLQRVWRTSWFVWWHALFSIYSWKKQGLGKFTFSCIITKFPVVDKDLYCTRHYCLARIVLWWRRRVSADVHHVFKSTIRKEKKDRNRCGEHQHFWLYVYYKRSQLNFLDIYLDKDIFRHASSKIKHLKLVRLRLFLPFSITSFDKIPSAKRGCHSF